MSIRLSQSDLLHGAALQLRGALKLKDADRQRAPKRGLDEVLLPADLKDQLLKVCVCGGGGAWAGGIRRNAAYPGVPMCVAGMDDEAEIIVVACACTCVHTRGRRCGRGAVLAPPSQALSLAGCLLHPSPDPPPSLRPSRTAASFPPPPCRW